MPGQFLSKHPGESLLLIVIVVGFLILPLSGFAKDVSDISSKKISKELSMKSKKTEVLVHSLIQVLTDEMIKQYSSPSSSPKERAIPTILKHGVQMEALNYLLTDAPVNVSYKVVTEGIDLARIAFASDISVLLKRLEKKSAEKAAKKGEEWLFHKQIRTAPGTIKVEYESKEGKKQKVIFQYVLIYKPLSNSKGKVAVKVYSPNKVAPPKSEGSIAFTTGMVNSLEKPLPPFIVTINGTVEKVNYGAYGWVDDPKINIKFPDNVPDLGIEPLGFWERHLVRPAKSNIGKVKVLVGKMKGGGGNLSNLFSSTANKAEEFTENTWSDIKEGAATVNPFGAQVVGTGESEPKNLQEDNEQPQQKDNVVQKDDSDKPDKDEEKTKKEKPEKEEDLKQEDNRDKKEKHDDLAKRLDKITQKVKEVEEKFNKKKKDEQKQEKEEKESSCVALNEAKNKRLQKITGVGPVMANKIIDFRNSGFFYAIKDLTNINGIGSVTVNNVKKQGLACVKTDKERPEKEKKKEKDKQKQQEDQEETNECIALNGASNERLQQITGVGPVTAGKIIEFRQTNDIYTFEDLDQVYGIGSVTVSNIEEQDLACIEIEKPRNYSPGGNSVTNTSANDNSDDSDNGSSEQNVLCDQENLTRVTSSVVINEVAWMGNASSTYDEWLELNNISNSSVSLEDWQLIGADPSDEENKIEVFFEQDTIATNTYYLMERSNDTSIPGISADKTFTGGINNGNYVLRLFDDNCKLHFQVKADPDWSAGSNGEKLRTMEKGSGWYPSNATSSIKGLFGTPKAQNSEFSTSSNNLSPIASFNVSSDLKTGQEVTFDASSSTDLDGSIVQYKWEFGGKAATSATDTITHAFSQSGTTTITLTIIDNQGATSSTSTKLKVKKIDFEEVELANSLVISEVELADKEFVELYNASSNPITVDNWSLNYFSTGDKWNDPRRTWSFPTSTIETGQHYLIGVQNEGEKFPGSDWQVKTEGNNFYSQGQLANDGGSVGIFSCNPEIATSASTSLEQAVGKAKNCKVDVVGWGEVKVNEKQSATLADKSLSRRVATTTEGYIKYVDSDNNFNDFVNKESSFGVITPNSYSDLDNDGIINSQDATTTVSTSTSLAAGSYSFNYLEISNATLTLKSKLDREGFKGVEINANKFVVATSAVVSANKQGYTYDKNAHESRGPGAGDIRGYGGSGGGHGGRGGKRGNAKGGAIYGSLKQPTTLGSSGGGFSDTPGGSGGGAIKLNIQNRLSLNGLLSANGENGEDCESFKNSAHSGGGSGGSIYINTDNLTGSGSVQANGGSVASSGGGGAGGRIAIYYNNNSFAGTVEAFGGNGQAMGGAGTIFKKDREEETEKLIIKNSDLGESITTFNKPAFTNLKIINSKVILPEQFTVSSSFISNNSLIKSATSATSSEITGGDINISSSSNWRGNFIIETNSLTLTSNSHLSADGQGYTYDKNTHESRGPGAGEIRRYGGSGGGHGGRGGKRADAKGGAIYGSLKQPTALGSSGGGFSDAPSGSGGGAIHINASSTTIDGIISANGTHGDCNGNICGGGGSGGSIYINTGQLTGSASSSIQANGGSVAGSGGGGAGGRIAISSQQDNFEGDISATGGQSGRNNSDGAAGTIFIGNQNKLIVNNKGASGAWTPLSNVNISSLEVASGSKVILPSQLLVGGLFQTENAGVRSATNSTTTVATSSEIEIKNSNWRGNFKLNADNLTLDASSSISADGKGYSAEQGPPAEQGAGIVESGAGHGGFGGGDEKNVGRSYDSTTSPVMLGSGGGADRGGSGGGSVQINTNNLELDGSLSANGTNGRSEFMSWNGGGGSGGSILIKTDEIKGSGQIKANGGDGCDQEKGAGAGGRVAVYFSTSSFATSSVEVQPGSGEGNLPAESGSIFWGDGLLE